MSTEQIQVRLTKGGVDPADVSLEILRAGEGCGSPYGPYGASDPLLARWRNDTWWQPRGDNALSLAWPTPMESAPPCRVCVSPRPTMLLSCVGQFDFGDLQIPRFWSLPLEEFSGLLIRPAPFSNTWFQPIGVDQDFENFCVSGSFSIHKRMPDMVVVDLADPSEGWVPSTFPVCLPSGTPAQCVLGGAWNSVNDGQITASGDLAGWAPQDLVTQYGIQHSLGVDAEQRLHVLSHAFVFASTFTVSHGECGAISMLGADPLAEYVRYEILESGYSRADIEAYLSQALTLSLCMVLNNQDPQTTEHPCPMELVITPAA